MYTLIRRYLGRKLCDKTGYYAKSHMFFKGPVVFYLLVKILLSLDILLNRTVLLRIVDVRIRYVFSIYM